MKTPVVVILLLSLLLQTVSWAVAAQPNQVSCSMGCCTVLPVDEHCGCISAPAEEDSTSPSLPVPAQGRDSLPQPANANEMAARETRLRPPQVTFKTLAVLANEPVPVRRVRLAVLFCAFLT